MYEEVSRPSFGSGRENQHRYYQYGSQIHNAPIITHPYDSQSELFTDTRPVPIVYDDPITAPTNGTHSFQFSFKRLFQFAGPGWLMSIAYIDSGNLESMIQSGALAGYSLLWVLWWSTFAGWLVQCLCIRLATTTGQSLSQLCRYEYSRTTSILLWISVELSIIGSDIQQVIGTAIAFNILFGLKLWIGCILTAFTAFVLLAIHSWKGLRCMEYFFLSVISVMSVLFIVECTISAPDLLLILKGWIVPLIQDASNTAVQEQAIGIVGAVIMPFNLFLHSSLVQLRAIDRNNIAAIKEANLYFAVESGVSLLISFFINLCLLSVFAKGFYQNTAYEDTEAGLLSAAYFLNDRFGAAAKWIWAIGLLCSGQSATMTGTFAGQFIMNGFLDLEWSPMARTLLTRCIALMPSLIVAIFATQQFDTVNEWLNVEQSIILPFALLPLLFFSCNQRIMGNAFVLSLKMQVVYACIGCVVVFINVYLVCLFMLSWDVAADNVSLFAFKWIILSVFVCVYLGLIGWLLLDFVRQRVWSNDSTIQVTKRANDEQGTVDMTEDQQQSIPLLV